MPRASLADAHGSSLPLASFDGSPLQPSPSERVLCLATPTGVRACPAGSPAPGPDRASHEASRRTYNGSPRIHRDLRNQGHRVSRKCVIRLQQTEGLAARIRKRFRRTTMSDQNQPVAANMRGQDFVAEAPNQRWVGDTTEFVIGSSGKLYLAAVSRPLLTLRDRLGRPCH